MPDSSRRHARLARIRSATLVICGALSATPGLFAAAPVELPSQRERWIQVRSEHFSIYSSASERTARKLATRLERLRQLLARLGGERSLVPPRPTEIFVFKDERSFKRFVPPGPDGKPLSLGAYFLARSDQNTIALYDWIEGDPMEPILHEYLHSLLDVSYSRLPVWANEGLADFYSTFTVSDDGADLGRPVNDHLMTLGQRTRMPTGRLLAVTQDDPEYNEESRRTIFYAQAWFSTHYLLFGRPGRQGDFPRYLEAIEDGVEPVKAFTDAFGMTPEALEPELALYKRKGVYPFVKYRFDELPPLAEAALRPVSYPEALARLGDLLRRLGPAKRPEGIELIEAARRLDPASPLPPFKLGLARLDEGRHDEGESLLREALARDPGLEPVQAALGSLLVFGAPGRLPQDADAAEARELLRRSTAVEPGRLDSWIALGRAELTPGGDAKRAFHAFETAWKLAPRRSDLLGAYVMALAEDRQFARGAALLRATLLKSPRGDDRATGEMYLRRVAEREVLTLANEDRVEDALARLQVYLATSADPEMATTLNRYKTQLESSLAANRCVDGFNEAIRTANEQKFAEARPKLEKVIAECADESLVARAREVLTQIQGFEKKKR